LAATALGADAATWAVKRVGECQAIPGVDRAVPIVCHCRANPRRACPTIAPPSSRHERQRRGARLPKPIGHVGLFRPPEHQLVDAADRRDVLRTFDLDDRPRASYGSVAPRLVWTMCQVKICPASVDCGRTDGVLF
jgi:hypothetical protein